jgi:hypothetical protein
MSKINISLEEIHIVMHTKFKKQYGHIMYPDKLKNTKLYSNYISCLNALDKLIYTDFNNKEELCNDIKSCEDILVWCMINLKFNI